MCPLLVLATAIWQDILLRQVGKSMCAAAGAMQVLASRHCSLTLHNRAASSSGAGEMLADSRINIVAKEQMCFLHTEVMQAGCPKLGCGPHGWWLRHDAGSSCLVNIPCIPQRNALRLQAPRIRGYLLLHCIWADPHDLSFWQQSSDTLRCAADAEIQRCLHHQAICCVCKQLVAP